MYVFVCSPATKECPGNGHICATPPQLVVMDLRSYAATLGNRAKGGGSECVGKKQVWYISSCLLLLIVILMNIYSRVLYRLLSQL